MAKSTTIVAVPVASGWIAISTVGDTVLVSIESSGQCMVAVATVVGDFAGADRGHVLGPVSKPTANFFALGAQAVFAKAIGVDASLAVTEY